MKKAIYIFTCFILYSNSTFSQDQGSDTCILGTKIFSSRRVEGIGHLYYSTNVISGKIDTLLISSGGYRKITCKCNDTLVTFLDGRAVKCFQKNGDKWAYKTSFALPDRFPLVGSLINGKKYEKYSHILVAPDQIAAVLTVLIADERQELTPVEKYDIITKIDIPNYRIITLSKTLKND